jgi:hypothetical protein
VKKEQIEQFLVEEGDSHLNRAFFEDHISYYAPRDGTYRLPDGSYKKAHLGELLWTEERQL